MKALKDNIVFLLKICNNCRLMTCSPLTYSQSSLAENNGNKRSEIITVTPGAKVSVYVAQHGILAGIEVL